MSYVRAASSITQHSLSIQWIGNWQCQDTALEKHPSLRALVLAIQRNGYFFRARHSLQARIMEEDPFSLATLQYKQGDHS